MKNLFKTVLFAAAGTVMFASCNSNKDNFDYDAEYLKQEKYIDSLLSAEKIKIEDYVNIHSPNATKDTTKIQYTFLDKKSVERGIWYEILSAPTDDKYEYKLNQNGMSLVIVFPKVKLKYTAKLLNGTVVESDDSGSDYNLGQNFSVRNKIWEYSFIPSKLKYNGTEYSVGGLTAAGLKKGSKIRVITPSIYAYASNAKDKIPSNSPLVYEFEVLEIE